MEDILKSSIGKVFYKLRNEKKLSQEQLSYKADVDRAFISDIERGRKMPSLTVIFKLAEVLDENPSEIIRTIENDYRQ